MVSDLRGQRLGNAWAIPHTGHRAMFRSWFRQPRHIGFKREAMADFGTMRGIEVPPSNWDDLIRARERTWKRHRKTQFHCQ